MTTEDVRHRDFWSAVGEEFAEAVCPPVAFEDASPQECCEAVRAALGQDVTPSVLAALTAADIARLADALGWHFEAAAPSPARVGSAVARILTRWPAHDGRQGARLVGPR